MKPYSFMLLVTASMAVMGHTIWGLVCAGATVILAILEYLKHHKERDPK